MGGVEDAVGEVAQAFDSLGPSSQAVTSSRKIFRLWLLTSGSGVLLRYSFGGEGAFVGHEEIRLRPATEFELAYAHKMRVSRLEVHRKNATQGLHELPWVGGCAIVLGTLWTAVYGSSMGVVGVAIGAFFVMLYFGLIWRRRADWQQPTPWDVPTEGLVMTERTIRIVGLGFASDSHEEGFRWVILRVPDAGAVVLPWLGFRAISQNLRALARERVVLTDYPNGTNASIEAFGDVVPVFGAVNGGEGGFDWSPKNAWTKVESPEGSFWDLGNYDEAQPAEMLPDWLG